MDIIIYYSTIIWYYMCDTNRSTRPTYGTGTGKDSTETERNSKPSGPCGQMSQPQMDR